MAKVGDMKVVGRLKKGSRVVGRGSVRDCGPIDHLRPRAFAAYTPDINWGCQKEKPVVSGSLVLCATYAFSIGEV